eukprot:768460-Hanusia_phi.AAC.6
MLQPREGVKLSLLLFLSFLTSLTWLQAFAAAVFENCIFVSGGYSFTADMEDTVEVFDPSWSPPRWSYVRKMSKARASHKLIALPDEGCILALGGQTSNGVASSIERYDPQEEEWTEVVAPSLTEEGASPSALQLPKPLTNFACVRLDELQFDIDNVQNSFYTKILKEHWSRLDVLTGNHSQRNTSSVEG